MTRASTYVFFTSYVSLTIVAVAQATFLPTILSEVATPTPQTCLPAHTTSSWNSLSQNRTCTLPSLTCRPFQSTGHGHAILIGLERGCGIILSLFSWQCPVTEYGPSSPHILIITALPQSRCTGWHSWAKWLLSRSLSCFLTDRQHYMGLLSKQLVEQPPWPLCPSLAS
jgi:hypothetical protein